MKLTNGILFIAIATAAPAQQMVDDQDRYHTAPPTRYEGQGVAGAVTPAWLVDNAGWSYATPARIAAEDAAAAAAAAQAEAQRVAWLAGEYAGAVVVLQANLVTVGWSIPCDAQAVTADLMGRAHAKTLTEEQREAKDDIFQAYFILQSKGVTNADIAAIWALIGGGE